MEKNGSTIGSIDDYMEATQRQSTQPKKEHFLAWLRNYAHTVGDHMPDENATCFRMGNLKGCGVSTKLKWTDAMKSGAAIRMPVVFSTKKSQISDLFATKVHLYVARYVQAIKCEF